MISTSPFHGRPNDFAADVRHEIRAVEPRAALVQPVTLEEVLDRWSYAQLRFSLIVLATFTAIGTVLVALGVFSVLAYTSRGRGVRSRCEWLSAPDQDRSGVSSFV